MVVLYLILVHVLHNQPVLELSLDPFNILNIYYRPIENVLEEV